MAKTFKSNGHPDPSLDINGSCNTTLDRLIRKFNNEDPACKRQPALPLEVFRILLNKPASKLEEALGTLACGALFFGMRSCEYLHVSASAEDRKTKTVKLENIAFRKKGKTIHSKLFSELSKATSVSITFEDQKNGNKLETITQFNTNDDLCPVKLWAMITSRIWKIPGASKSSKVNTFYYKSQSVELTSKSMRLFLRNACKKFGEQKLGFSCESVGTHSIRASFAMMLILNNERDSVIMKKGRWLSSAFLRYIREQVNSMGHDSSKKMIGKMSESFTVIPHLSKIKVSSF